MGNNADLLIKVIDTLRGKVGDVVDTYDFYFRDDCFCFAKKWDGQQKWETISYPNAIYCGQSEEDFEEMMEQTKYYLKFDVSERNKIKPVRIKAVYRKNLKMSGDKVASQVSHAVKNLGYTSPDSTIIVLSVSDKKFNEMIAEHQCYVQVDMGLTQVEAGTPTAAAWIENKL